jgi:hypothetical protein
MAWVVRRAGILLFVVVVALGPGGATAGAKKKAGKPWDSNVTLTHPLVNQFSGQVTSKLAACEKDRVVTVSYTDPNTGQTSPLSVQRTDGKGKYVVVLPREAFFGTYRAEVAQRKIRALKAKQTCRDAKSQVVAVG